MEDVLVYAENCDTRCIREWQERYGSDCVDILTNSRGETAFWLSVVNGLGFFDCASYLLRQCGADINVRNASNFSLLYEVVVSNRIDCVKFLLENNAQAESSWNGPALKTPLQIACELNHAEIVQLLVLHLRHHPLTSVERSISESSVDGKTALHMAAENGHLVICEFLLQATKNKLINAQSDTSATPLFKAAEHGQVHCVEMLLKRGARVDLPDHNGYTPLLIASQNGHRNVCEILLKPFYLGRAADVLHQNDDGLDALSIAGVRNHAHLVPFLEEKVHYRKVGLGKATGRYLRKRLKSEHENALLRAFLSGWRRRAYQLVRCRALRAKNEKTRKQRIEKEANRLARLLVPRWRRDAERRVNIHRIEKQLEQNHDKPMFAIEKLGPLDHLTLYKPSATFFEQIWRKKCFKSWKHYFGQLRRGKLFLRIATYRFMRHMLARFRVSCRSTGRRLDTAFRSLVTWYSNSKTLRKRRTLQRFTKRWRQFAVQEGRKNSLLLHQFHLEFVLKRCFGHWRQFRCLCRVKTDIFFSLQAYTRWIKAHRKACVDKVVRQRREKYARVSFDSIRQNHRSQKALKVQKIARGFLVRQFYRREIQEWKEKVRKESDHRSIVKKAKLALNILGKYEMQWSKIGFKKLSAALSTNSNSIFDIKYPVRTLHMRLRALGVRTSREHVMKLLRLFHLNVEETDQIDLPNLVAWLVLVGRDRLFRNFYKPRPKQLQKIVIHRETVRGTVAPRGATRPPPPSQGDRDGCSSANLDKPEILRDTLANLQEKDAESARVKRIYAQWGLKVSSASNNSITAFSKCQSPIDLLARVEHIEFSRPWKNPFQEEERKWIYKE